MALSHLKHCVSHVQCVAEITHKIYIYIIYIYIYIYIHTHTVYIYRYIYTLHIYIITYIYIYIYILHGQPHSSWVISLADGKGGGFERDETRRLALTQSAQAIEAG